MSNFIQEIKNHNINKALNLEMVFRTSDEDFNKSIDVVADTLNKSFLDGLVDEQAVEIDFKNLDVILEKARPHKYYRREGSPGNYKYYYTKEEYEKEKKGSSGGKEGLRTNESQRKTVENKPVGSIHEHNGKKYKKQANGKWLEVDEQGMTKKEHEDKSIPNYNIDRVKLTSIYMKLPLYRRKDKTLEQFISDSKNIPTLENKKHAEQASKLSDKEYDDTDFEEKEGSKEESKQSIHSWWNSMASSEKKKLFEDNPKIMEGLAHIYTVAGRREGRPNVGMAILNVSTGRDGKGLRWEELDKYLKKDLKELYSKSVKQGGSKNQSQSYTEEDMAKYEDVIIDIGQMVDDSVYQNYIKFKGDVPESVLKDLRTLRRNIKSSEYDEESLQETDSYKRVKEFLAG